MTKYDLEKLSVALGKDAIEIKMGLISRQMTKILPPPHREPLLVKLGLSGGEILTPKAVIPILEEQPTDSGASLYKRAWLRGSHYNQLSIGLFTDIVAVSSGDDDAIETKVSNAEEPARYNVVADELVLDLEPGVSQTETLDFLKKIGGYVTAIAEAQAEATVRDA